VIIAISDAVDAAHGRTAPAAQDDKDGVLARRKGDALKRDRADPRCHPPISTAIAECETFCSAQSWNVMLVNGPLLAVPNFEPVGLRLGDRAVLHQDIVHPAVAYCRS